MSTPGQRRKIGAFGAVDGVAVHAADVSVAETSASHMRLSACSSCSAAGACAASPVRATSESGVDARDVRLIACSACKAAGACVSAPVSAINVSMVDASCSHPTACSAVDFVKEILYSCSLCATPCPGGDDLFTCVDIPAYTTASSAVVALHGSLLAARRAGMVDTLYAPPYAARCAGVCNQCADGF